jgi:hypothetical protein
VNKFLKIVAGVVMISALIHGIVWLLDNDLIADKKSEAKTFDPKKLVTIKEIRLELEAKQKKEIDSYGWTDKAKGRVRIPVRRAFSYYLRSLRR